MNLGIVVTTEQAAEHAVGVLTAALRRGWTCRCFLTDRGVKVFDRPEFRSLLGADRVRVDVCELSWEKYDMGKCPDNLVMGGQYQDAELVHTSDRVLVL